MTPSLFLTNTRVHFLLDAGHVRVRGSPSTSSGVIRLDSSRYNDYYSDVKEAIQLDQPRVSSHPEEAAFLDLLRATDMLSRGLIAVLKTADLSSTQYNVLRILRGAPEGLPCGEVANRMITRDPDITRLLDRLEKRGLISRSREIKDRRTVTARITPAGLKLLGSP